MPQLDLFDVKRKGTSVASDSLLEREVALWKCGYRLIAGVDEVGRGPLAGPVVACACILPRGIAFHGVKDSKSLNPPERKRLADFLISHSDVHYSIACFSHEKVDELNILQATLLAMREALLTLAVAPDFVLVDGRDKPPTDIPTMPIIRGDATCQSIAAASIIAKVHRDELMDEYHKQYPEYGFDKHKGYGTAAHRKAIEQHGPCPIHRKSFAPFRLSQESKEALSFL